MCHLVIILNAATYKILRTLLKCTCGMFVSMDLREEGGQGKGVPKEGSGSTFIQACLKIHSEALSG